MENKNPYLKPISAVPSDQPPIFRASKRPKYSNIALLIVAIIFLVFGRDWVSWGVGIFVLLITIYSLYNLKDSYAADIYPDFIIVYFDNDSENCEIITWDQILEWKIQPGNIGPDTVVLRLENEQHTYITSYSTYGIMTQLNKKIQDKYYSELPQGEKFHFRDLLNMFKRKK